MQNSVEAYKLLSHCLNDGKITAKNEMVLVAAMSWETLKDNEAKSYFIKSLVSANGIGLDAYVAFLYAVRNDKTIDQYELNRNLQKSVMLKPIEYRKDDISKVQIQLSNPDKFQLKMDDWNIVRYDYKVKIGDERNEWSIVRRDAVCQFAEPDKFFETREELAAKTKDLEDHVELVTDWVSEIKLDDKPYYYISKSTTWEDVESYFCKYIAVEKGKYPKEVETRQKRFKKFREKYGVEKVDLYYQFEKEGEETPISYYSGPICMIDVEVKSSDNCNVKLCFRTDVIEKDDTYLRFWGVKFGEEEVKF